MKYPPEVIAQVVHGANRAFCAALNLRVADPWELLDQERRDSVERVVRAVAEVCGECTPAEIHDLWWDEQRRNGWTKGEYDLAAKTHPSMTPFAQLDQNEQTKDALVIGVIKAFL